MEIKILTRCQICKKYLRASSMKTIRGHELGYALVQTVLIGGPGKMK